jgi:hypothetical protein
VCTDEVPNSEIEGLFGQVDAATAVALKELICTLLRQLSIYSQLRVINSGEVTEA